jgi:lipopolysaccharide transport system ATP-binding protein
MRRGEINRKFDEIVEFSGIGTFIDTPAKRYSSGMYVRLAFAVAAHLEPEILFVDEVLAVGDAAFQRKCLGKMKDAVTEGRTVLFVSHNMAAVLNLCPRTILLEGGRIVADGDSEQVVSRYLQSLDHIGTVSLAERSDRKGNQILKFVEVELRNAEGMRIQRAQSGERVTIALRYQSAVRGGLNHVRAAIGVHGKFDENLFDMATDLGGFRFETIPQAGTLLCTIPCLPLQPGRYSFNAYCEVGNELADWVVNAGYLEIEPGDFFSSGKLPHADQGPFLVSHSWSVAVTDAASAMSGAKF